MIETALGATQAIILNHESAAQNAEKTNLLIIGYI
jgi:hypothetical protein